MVRPKKAPSNKSKRGVDFKKYKHKVGRKLPPPKNATNTQIKSKAIVLPEQSVVSDRAGLAVNRRGLTLRELIQQTSHYNPNVRRAALDGIKDLIRKNPEELDLHRDFILERLREKIVDTDKGVRDKLYLLLQNVIIPHLKEDVPEPAFSSLMAYIVTALAHYVHEIRFTAFKFFELIVQNCPTSFITHAEKVLENYIVLFGKTDIYSKDKVTFRSALDGLVVCLRLLAKNSVNTVQNVGGDSPASASSEIDQRNITSDNFLFKGLQELIPILINHIEDSSLLFLKQDTDTHLSGLLPCALQCVNLMCSLLSYEINKPNKLWLCTDVLPGHHSLDGSMFLALNKLWKLTQLFAQKEEDIFFVLSAKVAEIFLILADHMDELSFAENLVGLVINLLRKVKKHYRNSMEKHTVQLVKSVPILLFRHPMVSAQLLEAFTEAFVRCSMPCEVILMYLSVMEEILLHDDFQNWLFRKRYSELFVTRKDAFLSTCSEGDEYYLSLLEQWRVWLLELPRILIGNVEKQPAVEKAVLSFLLRIGKTPLAIDYFGLPQLVDFYIVKSPSNKMQLGPFVNLPEYCQKLAVCCLAHFYFLLPDMLECFAVCISRDDLKPILVFRIMEVIHSVCKSGHLPTSDLFSFLLTLVTRFNVFPDKFHNLKGKYSNFRTFWILIKNTLKYLSQMGDGPLLLQLLWDQILGEIARKPSTYNLNGLLRIVVALDVRLSRLSDNDIVNLSSHIAGYLVDITMDLREDMITGIHVGNIKIFPFFISPCLSLFCRNAKLLFHTLEALNSFVMGEKSIPATQMVVDHSFELSRRLRAVSTILMILHHETQLDGSVRFCEPVAKIMIQNLQTLLDSNSSFMLFEDIEKLKYVLSQMNVKYCEQQRQDRPT